MEEVSPRYIMKLIDELEPAIWAEFPNSKYKKVLLYIKKWHADNGAPDQWYEENFHIYYKDVHKNEIDLTQTLHSMPIDLVLKIAIDIGLETPNFIPCIPTFRNGLKEEYKTASNSFEKAFKQMEENPDLAISLANSTLESVVKQILQDEKLVTKLDNRKTTYDLIQDILKEFNMFPSASLENEIREIGSGLLKSCKNIEALRSNKTFSHGKTKEDYVIDDPLYAYFIVNSIASIGLFLISFYKKKYKIGIKNNEEISIEDLPF